MSIKNVLASSLIVAVLSSTTSFAALSSPDAMRGASAVQNNSKLASSVNLTRDANSNIVSFHVNGISSSDANIILTQSEAPLSTEYTYVNGTTQEGTSCCYVLPTNVATALVVEQISKDLVNSGSVSIQITKQNNGKQL